MGEAAMVPIIGDIYAEGEEGKRRTTTMNVEAGSVEYHCRHNREAKEETQEEHPNPQDAWLPITESRKGNAFTSTLHLLCTGLGIQSLLLPVAFAALGWFWGVVCLWLAFAWHLYTMWILVQLHECVPGVRFSRYLHLTMAAFGEKRGKLLGLFPVMYLSGGTCVTLIITGGGALDVFYQVMSGNEPTGDPLTRTEWFVVFTCLAIASVQFFPNLYSAAVMSFIGAATAVAYCTLIWSASVSRGREDGVVYSTSELFKSDVERFRGVVNAVEIIFLAFRGHNLVLEIQGTMPSSSKRPSREGMWTAVKFSYPLIASCLFPLAILGYWTYGNKMTPDTGILAAFWTIHGHKTTKYKMAMIYLLIIVNCSCTYQIFAMPFFDNLERIYITKKNRRCPRWLRSTIRFFFGGLTLFVAIALPFIGSLASILGGITLPLAYVYPCFMWIAFKQPRENRPVWCLNAVVGCLGVVVSVLFVVVAVWNIAVDGLVANFFKPR